MATGQSLIRAEICKALSLPMETISKPVYDGVWCNYILHSNIAGALDTIYIEPDFEREHVKDKGFIVSKGDAVVPFSGANNSLGTVFLRADDRKELDYILSEIDKHIHIILL